MWRWLKLFFTFVSVFAVEDKKEKPCGVEASTNLIHHNPWLVYLEYYRHQNLYDIRCGGSLISTRHVITAAHCVKKNKFTRVYARLGEYDISAKADCVGDVCADALLTIKVDKIIAHPEYDGSTSPAKHDIAILVLAEDAPYTDFIRPVCLPSGELEEKVTFTASGWGILPTMGYYSDTKKILLLPNWNIEDCKAAYSDIELPDHIICAGGEENVDTCNGDSGGPLTWIRKRIELWGVTSSGRTRCGTKGSPGIFTKVTDHLDWIRMVMHG